MTNEEAKQAAIIKAYGDIWAKLRLSTQSCALSNDGWIAYKESKLLIDSGMAISCFQRIDGIILEVRPHSLNVIENNNGWTRVDPDGGNLPERDFRLYEMSIDGSVSNGVCTGANICDWWHRYKDNHNHRVTHFKKWEPSNAPIY